jgi:hypothetical protein
MPNGQSPMPMRLATQLFPDDAHAVIYKPGRSAMTSGKGRTRDWKLRFERRTPPIIEPLMGWTEGDDTLSQIELSFPSAEAAIAYARRQGLRYSVQGMSDREPPQIAGHFFCEGRTPTEPLPWTRSRKSAGEPTNASGLPV